MFGLAAKDSDFTTISTMAQRYSVSLRTLRFYEQQGLLMPMRANAGRFYSAKDEIRLQLILRAKRFGFSLTEIKALLADRAEKPELVLTSEVVSHQIGQLEARREEINGAIAELQSALGTRHCNAAVAEGTVSPTLDVVCN